MKKCEFCGYKIINKSKICPECGHVFNVKNEVKLYSVKVKDNRESKPQNPQQKIDDSNHKLDSKNIKKDNYEKTRVINSPPHYQFYLIFSSVFFSIFWLIPLIGLIASVFAFNDLLENDYSKKDTLKIWTLVAIFIHSLYLLNTFID